MDKKSERLIYRELTKNSFLIMHNVRCHIFFPQASQTVDSLNVTKQTDVNTKHVCGRRSLDHTELVSIRTEAKAGDWPWHVAILTKKPDSNETSYYCGGNIISTTAVLTGK